MIKKENLFKDDCFEGFAPKEQNDFLSRILNSFEYKERNDELEKNFAFKQPIPYVWIINPQSKKVFAYRRAAHKGYTEKRLWGKWSCGIGGHIDKATEEFSENPIEDAMMREMQEEVVMSSYPDPTIIGYLNVGDTEVDKVHFGVVAVAEVDDFVEIGNAENNDGKFYSAKELDEIFSNPENDVENWTKVSWPAVKSYVESL